MSVHFDKCGLNTYYGTPYFQAHIPPDYPLSLTLQKCRAFRRLPPRLRELSTLAKQWTRRKWPYPTGIEQWYDDEGYELNPRTGNRLTDEEIDDEWDRYHPNLGLDDFTVEDIPLPAGGFADPETWEEPPAPPDEPDPEGPTEDSLVRDIASRGREYTAKYYGVPTDQLRGIKTDRDLARLIFRRLRGK